MISLISMQYDIKNNWAEISAQKGNPGRNYKEAALLAHDIYINSIKGKLSLILIGPGEIRKKVKLVAKYQLVTRTPKKPKGKVCTGAILGEPQWSTLINDAFLLGAIEAKKTVRLLSKAPLWDGKTFTSTGRELALLYAAGYQIKPTKGKSIDLFPSEQKTAQSLEELWTTLKSVTIANLTSFLEP